MPILGPPGADPMPMPLSKECATLAPSASLLCLPTAPGNGGGTCSPRGTDAIELRPFPCP